eukprot:TRINITY_DN21975_c0_g1_i1.p1 TRINITY_DN21975_c0_g1~~TRINITY_DN21975_c0_g1_i1.p1  ORF type:complete len:302 (+),score=107.04 TRINITY_DN21975_c0_g1_i1:79-984(+)
MSFTFKGGQVVQAGEDVRVPIPVAEASSLDVEWSSEGGQDLHFVIEFDLEDSKREQLLSDENSIGGNEKGLKVGDAGTCILVWKNCYVGWLGGAARKLAYSVSLTSNEELARREEEARRLQAEREAAERRRQEAEAREKRLAALADELQQAERTTQEAQQAVEELTETTTSKRKEINELRQRLQALESDLAADEASLERRRAERLEAVAASKRLQTEKSELLGAQEKEGEASEARSTSAAEEADDEVKKVDVKEEGREKFTAKLEQRGAAIWDSKVQVDAHHDDAAEGSTGSVEHAAAAGA